MRKSIVAFVSAAFVVVLAGGCAQEEDLSDINDAWMSATDELSRDIDETRQDHQQLSQRFNALKEVEFNDPEQITLRNKLETTLMQHLTTLDDVRQMLQDDLRSESLEGGRRGDFESAWSQTQTNYAAARAKLEELRTQHDALSEDVDTLEEAVGGAKSEMQTETE